MLVSAAMISLSCFSKRYRNFSGKKCACAANRVSLAAAPGSVTVLAGPNGSGKSTLMKAVYGIHCADFGSVCVSGRDGSPISPEDDVSAARDSVGYVPEIPALPPRLYVAGFLLSAAQMHGMSCGEAESAVRRTASACGLEPVMGRRIGTLSKGWLQKVSFAQALVHSPPNVLLDEPMSGLDPVQTVRMRSLISELALSCTVLMSTHSMQEAERLGNMIFIMNSGRIAASGTARDICVSCGADDLETAFVRLTAGGDR